MKYTTKVMIPESTKSGDQRIIFTDNVLGNSHRQIRVLPSQIMNILPYDSDGAFGYCKIFKRAWREVASKLKMKDFPECETTFAFDQFREEIAVKETKKYKHLYIRADGYDNKYIIAIKPKTFQTLSDYVWGQENHKEI